MSKSLNFHAEDTDVQTVLFSTHMYKIPRYQRPYAWEEDQVTEFWNDLVNTKDSYFLGSWIFNNETKAEDGRVDIIDGQQRLLTITIFMAVLRDIATTVSKDLANRIQRQDIAIEDRNGNQTFRVLPGDSLQTFFSKHIQSTESDIFESKTQTPEQLRVKKNYELLHGKVVHYLEALDSQEKKVDYLEKLRETVSNLLVINIQIQSEEDAYEIFETTNARGIELSVSDLLKNLIFRKMPPTDIRDYAKDLWMELTDTIQGTGIDLKRFIRYYWISKYSFVTEKRLYREIKNEITDWKELLEDLWFSAQWFSKMIDPGEDSFNELNHSERIYKSLSSIRLMNVSQCYVFLLSLFRNYEQLETDPIRIIEIIEKFTFQYSAVSSQPGNRIEKLYSKYGILLQKTIDESVPKKLSGNVQSTLSKLEKDLKTEAPSYEVFAEKFDLISYKQSAKSRMLIKYILSNVDSYYRETEELIINFNAVNIEHILPQKPHPDWDLTEKEIKPYVNRLGNLTLLSIVLNSKIQNSTIEKKIPFLEKSDLPITKELVKILQRNGKTWTEKEIVSRHEFLAKLAYEEIWNLT